MRKPLVGDDPTLLPAVVRDGQHPVLAPVDPCEVAAAVLAVAPLHRLDTEPRGRRAPAVVHRLRHHAWFVDLLLAAPRGRRAGRRLTAKAADLEGAVPRRYDGATVASRRDSLRTLLWRS